MTSIPTGQTTQLILCVIAIVALFGGVIAAVVGLAVVAAGSPVAALVIGLGVIVGAVIMAAILTTPRR
jgi:hypothetical protein